jgi:predicted DNA-binding protein (UPF0251 family)
MGCGGCPAQLLCLGIDLRYGADLKQREIADILGLPVGTVKSRLHNALKKFRQQLEVGRLMKCQDVRKEE